MQNLKCPLKSHCCMILAFFYCLYDLYVLYYIDCMFTNNFPVPVFHIPLLTFILTLLLFALFKAFANVAAISYFKLSRLIPATVFNLHFIHLLQITNEHVKQELLFYYTSSSSNSFSLLEILYFVNLKFCVLTNFHTTGQFLGWVTMFKVAVLAVIHVCYQAVRWHRCFRICLQKSWENNIFSQFSLLSLFSTTVMVGLLNTEKKCQNLPALAGIPVHFCKPDRTHLLQLFHTY